jgi:hypothetical protein
MLAVALNLEAVSAGQGQTCRLTTDHRAYCWGSNFLGTLGDGTSADRFIPVEVAPPL